MRALTMIPLPLRIAGLVLIGALAYRLVGGALDAWMITLAILLWLIVLLTMAYDFGWLNSLAKVPGFAGFFGFMSNSKALQTQPGADAGPRGQLSDADRAKLFAQARATLASLEGIEPTESDIMERLIGPAEDDSDNPFGTQAPGLVTIFSGPRGVGKTTAATAAARMLAGKAAIETANIVTVRATDLRSGQYGSAAELARSKAEQAVGGTLLIEDAGWLLEGDGYGGPGPGQDFGQAMLDVMNQHPRRIFVALTGSPDIATRLQQAPDVARWLDKLTTRIFRFEDLSDDTLIELLEQRLEDTGWALEDDDAARQARRLMIEVRDRAGDGFDNAESCRRLAEQLVELVRSEGDDETVRQKVVGRDTIRAMDDRLG